MTLLCRKVLKFQRCSETDTVYVLLTQGETHSSGVQPSFATKNADGLPEIVSTKTSLRRRKSAFTMSQLPRLLFKPPCAACPSTTNGPPPRRRDPRARSAPPARSSRCPPPRARSQTSRHRAPAFFALNQPDIPIKRCEIALMEGIPPFLVTWKFSCTCGAMQPPLSL